MLGTATKRTPVLPTHSRRSMGQSIRSVSRSQFQLTLPSPAWSSSRPPKPTSPASIRPRMP